MEPGTIDENIVFLIGKASDLFYKRVTSLLREMKLDVTVEQFSVLTILWYDDGLLQQEIANRLNRDKTTLTRVIHNMEKRNLVVRVSGQTDRREKHIHLTHLGKQLQETLTNASGKIYLESLEGFSDTELKQLAGMLNHIIHNLKTN